MIGNCCARSYIVAMSDDFAPRSARKSIRCFLFGTTEDEGEWHALRAAVEVDDAALKEQEKVSRAQFGLTSVDDARQISAPHPPLGPNCMHIEASRVLGLAKARESASGARVGMKRTYVGELKDNALFFGIIPRPAAAS